MKEIKGFAGQWRPLSNFWNATVNYDGLSYLNTEAAFQAQKTLNMIERQKFCNVNPSEAKKLGRSLFLRSDWELIKEQLMYEIVLAKFSQNEELRNLLLSSDDAYLEETNNWHDNTWGVCNCNRCISKIKHNFLGKILMRVREELK